VVALIPSFSADRFWIERWKKLRKLVHVCRSYRKNKIGTLFFRDTVHSMACVHQCAPCGLRPSENRPHSFRGGRRKRRRNQVCLSSVLWSVFCVFIMASLIVFGYFPCSVSWLSLVVNFGASDWQKRSPKCADGDVKPYSFTQADQSMNSILNVRT